MDLGLRLETRQKLMMTQELRQAIAVLQLSTQELTAMVEQQFLENPLLEMDAPSANDQSRSDESLSTGLNADHIAALDDYFKSSVKTHNQTPAYSEGMTADVFTAKPTSLYEHLQLQLAVTFRDGQEYAIGQYMIGCIDDRGYLCQSVEEIAQALSVCPLKIGQVLAVIQTFDPDGVGARNLQECLAIQAQQRGIYSPLVEAVIARHLPDLANVKYRQIAQQLNCTPQAVQQAADTIRTLNPKPGLAYSAESAAYITADVSVERINDKYVILVNDSMVPRLIINPSYRQAARHSDSEIKKFVENRLNSALWLIRSVEQRRNTLYRVAEAIVELQQPFFDNGPQWMRPLIMKTVAEKLDIHESTVSRAVANKYINTPHGLFSMRAFFAACVSQASGEDIVASKIKQHIKALLADENAASPLSDQAISNLLDKQGVRISRRTVTKYREEMGIASSTKRKRY